MYCTVSPHRSAWSIARPVKLKKLRYSSATMRLKSLLWTERCRNIIGGGTGIIEKEHEEEAPAAGKAQSVKHRGSLSAVNGLGLGRQSVGQPAGQPASQHAPWHSRREMPTGGPAGKKREKE